MVAANAILVKVNQIGTLTETINAVKMANDTNWNAIISHRSGETRHNYRPSSGRSGSRVYKDRLTFKNRQSGEI